MIKNLHHNNINDIRDFLKVNKSLKFEFETKEEKYQFIDKTLKRLKYWKLNKKDKGLIISYLKLLTGYERSQLMVLVKRSWAGRVEIKKYKRNTFPKKYTDHDIALLAETDNLHLCLNSKATRSIFKREYEKFGKIEYGRLAGISSSHIYNLRDNNIYKVEYGGLNYTKTTYASSSIGERRKPKPNGSPGYIRVDSVHQGDFEGEKGVYHINSIDEVTQWEVIGAVERISEYYLLPILKDIIESYPFRIIEFHADNGSEYINRQVARMLNKLTIELTKSRPRKSNDNAQVEGKNGSVIRKHTGRSYIQGSYAPRINEFYMGFFNPYLNYHRPSGYATEIVISKYGKIKKVYNDYMPPYEKLKELSNANKYLKEGITFERLDKEAYAMSDNESAKEMQKEKDKLFETFKIMERKENL